MGRFGSFFAAVLGSVGFHFSHGLAFSNALDVAAFGRNRADHSHTVYRKAGGRAHRAWRKRRAAGRA